MKKFITTLLKKLLKTFDEEEVQTQILVEEPAVINELPSPKLKRRQGKVYKEAVPIPFFPGTTISKGPVRDVMALMDMPFVSLSKNRTKPIIYESVDKKKRVVISGHRDHFIASIYDWDIILVVSGKLQETINNGLDIPSRTIVISRHELLKALHKHDGKKQHKDLEKSLSRLKATLIDTTVGNNRGGCGFIDSWEYKERETNRDKQIIRITLSEWLYELCCAQGNLLKTDPLYFCVTSGLKRFLYRTARKHAGNSRDGWEFSVEKLYEKSGSESEFRKFKSKLKETVLDDDIPAYSLKWIVKNKKAFVYFKNSKMQTKDEVLEMFEEKIERIKEAAIL